MAENNKKENQVNYQNFANVVGYLKDNTLKSIVTSTHKEAINGQLVIAIDAEKEYRVKFMASKTYGDGKTANPLYTALQALMPDKTITIKTLLEANEKATFEEVKLQATKAWCNTNFDIYDRKDEKGEIHTSAMLNGRNAGVFNANSKKPFEPRATFKVEGYVNKLKMETKNEAETGRAEVEILLPDTYHETVMPITFFTTSELGSVVLDNWKRGDTILAEGYLMNSRVEVAPARTGRVSLTGKVEETAPTYAFVNERIINEPYPAAGEEDVKFLKADTIRAYSANRQKMLDELEVTADRGDNNSAPTTAPLTAATANDKSKFVL